MPEMDGIETTRRLGATLGTREIPKVIMVTAYDKDEAITQAKGLDISGVLVKPFNATTLAEAIMVALHMRMDEDITASAPESAAQPDWIGTPVLLVEDNEFNQLLAQELLEQAGFVVTLAENGRDGVDAVKGGSFAGVLMDCQMPILDGYSASREIRADPRFKDLPIIAMTANAMIGDRERAMEAGMNDYISKPLDIDQLFLVLAKWLKPVGAKQLVS